MLTGAKECLQETGNCSPSKMVSDAQAEQREQMGPPHLPPSTFNSAIFQEENYVQSLWALSKV